MASNLTVHPAVIPNLNSLWKYLPSDRSAPYWKTDQDFNRTEGDPICLATSLRGRSHARDGGFRDDDFCLSANRQGGWHIAAVADGAGSAKFSRHGTHLATKTVLNQLPALLDDIVTPGLDQLLTPYLDGHPDAASQIKAQLFYRSLITVAFNDLKVIETEAA